MNTGDIDMNKVRAEAEEMKRVWDEEMRGAENDPEEIMRRVINLIMRKSEEN